MGGVVDGITGTCYLRAVHTTSLPTGDVVNMDWALPSGYRGS